MALRTFAFNDLGGIPWFAPKKKLWFQRGLVNNVKRWSFDATTGEFTPVALSEGQRDVYTDKNPNPIGNFQEEVLLYLDRKH